VRNKNDGIRLNVNKIGHRGQVRLRYKELFYGDSAAGFVFVGLNNYINSILFIFYVVG
jgi:hypothetical protein